MNESKYKDDDYVLYYVKGILVSGHIEFNTKFDTIGCDTYLYTIRRFAKAGSIDTIIEEDLIDPSFAQSIKDMDI